MTVEDVSVDIGTPVRLIKLHHLRPAPGSRRARIRVGRGEGSKGKTAGRGTKGTKARAPVRPGFAGGQIPLHMSIPKLKGFKNHKKVEYSVISIKRLCEAYPSGGVVTRDNVMSVIGKKRGFVKLLSDGEVTVKFDITVDKASAAAVEKITSAAGTVTQAR
ncbi:MAG: 50S ribosomal protein L15 [Tropheryma whipplei]|uniref:50S ribosomal protein L15 n=1 Tax=Tropheryma whipplei TaxID=2039 RepID=UPI000309418A|nr:50S ribosomal protein L15 [Tropheryma whipplei]MCO8182563.1 50S ribosomal protein L15 [Tropheryma whipplei]